MRAAAAAAAAPPPPPPPSMSKGFHQQQQGINISFSNGIHLEDQHHHHQPPHIAQQNRRDKLRVQGFDPPPSMVGIGGSAEEPGGGGGGGGGMPVYETGGGMWSDMFNFQPSGSASTSNEYLDNQISSSNYRLHREAAAVPIEWYGNRQGMGSMGPLGDSKQPNNHSDNRDSSCSSSSHIAAQNHHQISSLNADSTAAMQLFLMNPQPRSPSPTHHHQGFHPPPPIPPPQFQWHHNKIGDNQQGLSLSLSTSLQHLQAAKAEEFRMGDDGVFYYNQPMLQRSSVGVVSLLRNSKYVKAAQELLEEFCSVGRGHLKNSRSFGRQNSNLNSNPPNQGSGSSSASKDPPPPLSAADRIDYQRKKTKLLSMLDEVDRRYNHYCEQMQVVVNSFDSVMGFGSATPYTALAQKAMSRHFRCLKDAITTQLKQTCELLGENDSAGVSGVTKGETPRLKYLEQSLRQQRAFHQMGMMEQEAWRPQRGLPERSVNILRAWLFEHFLHPYPSDADKHLLARQTGLSRNQVSNWFINARVRLWKPMVEEMYQQEAKDEEEGDEDERESNSNTAQTPKTQLGSTAATIPTTSAATTTSAGKRSEINDPESDPSLNAINTQCFSDNQAIQTTNLSSTTTTTTDVSSFATLHSEVPHFGVDDPSYHVGGIIGGGDYRTTSVNADMASTLLRFGTTMGDVSLTLGLRHTGNLPEKSHFSVRDFGGC